MNFTKTLLLSSALFASLSVFAQPNPDREYNYKLSKKAYALGSGPKITIDEGHNNLHKKDGGLLPLVKMLENDGFRVGANTESINSGILDQTDIYVIVNPLHDSNVGNWVVPNPSAFSEEEINALVSWVKKGGNLLLVADHMPYGGAVQDLASQFGVEWNNGFALRNGQNWPPSTFALAQGTLKTTNVTKRHHDFETITDVASFTGSVFHAPEEASVFMEYDDSHFILMPDTAWQFHANTKAYNSKGWQQGASFNFGEGRVVILGEAAMITAQVLDNGLKVGINSPQAPQNAQLALNIFHYLSGLERYQN